MSLSIKTKWIYTAFIVITLISEFYYIEVAGGALRLYHIFAPLVIITLVTYIAKLISTGAFIALALFVGWNFVAALLSEQPFEALTSWVLLLSNILIAIATALILVSRRLELEFLFKVVLAVTLVAIVWSTLQVAAFHLLGINLALSETQETQIRAGFGPAFRTEANTFAKYLNATFLLFLPALLYRYRWRTALLIALLFIVGMLICFTRSALYGTAATLLVAFCWYLAQGRNRLVSPRPLTILGLLGLTFTFYSFIVDHFNPYGAQKLLTLFSPGQIMEGSSAQFRFMSQDLIWQAFVATDRSILVGNGWGQITFWHSGGQLQAGGSELLTTLAYGGILSGIFYLSYQLSAIRAAYISAKSANPKKRAFYEGIMFSVLGLFITGQINGALIAPEYWLIFGLAIFCNAELRTRLRNTPPPYRLNRRN